MRNQTKRLILTLVITTLGITAFWAPEPALANSQPARRVYIVRPLRYYPLWRPFWYDPFWYGSPWYEPRYTVVREPQGTIKTEIEPKDAQVYINGGYVGTAGKFRGVFHGLNLRPGTYELEFRAPNYEPLKLKVYVAADKTLKIKEHLTPQMG